MDKKIINYIIFNEFECNEWNENDGNIDLNINTLK